MKRRFIKVLLSFMIVLSLLYLSGWIYVSLNTYQSIFDDDTWKLAAVFDQDVLVFSNEHATSNIVFYPGGFVEYDAYGYLGYLLSLEGFNVYIVKMPVQLAILGVSRFEEIYASYPSSLPWYIGGHSLGAASASIYVKDHYHKIAGIFFLGSYPANKSDLSQLDIKVLSITASNDLILNKENYIKTQRLLPNHTVFLNIEGGNHGYFGYYGMQRKDGVATITREQQHASVVYSIKTWINV